MGIIAIVIGASLLSFKPTPGRREFIGKKGFGVFLAGALFAGSGLVLNKQASYGLPVVPLFGAYSLGIACAFTIYSIRPTTLRQVACVVRDRAKLANLRIEIIFDSAYSAWTDGIGSLLEEVSLLRVPYRDFFW